MLTKTAIMGRVSVLGGHTPLRVVCHRKLFIGGHTPLWVVCHSKLFIGGIAQLVEQTAHIRSVIGPSPIAAKFYSCF